MKIIVTLVIFNSLVIICFIVNDYLNQKRKRAKSSKKVFHYLGILLLILILIIGVIARIYMYGRIPNGMQVDEAADAYDSYSLLHYGIDMNGYKNPAVLVHFGEGNGVLYSYLSMPFMALFGMNQSSFRLTNLIFGIFSLVIFYLLIRRTDGTKAATVGLFLLATNPWHIMISRWGLASNLLPAVFLIATYFLTLYEKNHWFLILSMAFYGLALYSYGVSFFLIPVYIFLLVIYLLILKKISIKTVLIGLLVLLLISLPILTYLIINTFKLDPILTSWISIPRTAGPSRFLTISTLFAKNGFFEKILNNFVGLVKLLIYQEDGLIQNSVPGYGTNYLFGLPFLLIGLWVAVKDAVKGKKIGLNALFLIWFMASVLLGMAMEVNINRINIIFIPIIYFIARAILYIYDHSKIFAYASMLLFVIGFLFFSNTYFFEYPKIVNPAMNESLGDAINFAADNTNGTIYISRAIHLPYIYVLFYRPISPYQFLDTVVYENPNSDTRDASSLGQYRFLPVSSMPSDGGAYIIDFREQGQYKLDQFDINQFKYFRVLMPKE
jgi:4-amino-4-deoxy-L-arabinose transferase-like glycosyltransferase